MKTKLKTRMHKKLKLKLKGDTGAIESSIGFMPNKNDVRGTEREKLIHLLHRRIQGKGSDLGGETTSQFFPQRRDA